MELNNSSKIKELLKFLPQQFFSEKDDENLIENLRNYYGSLGFEEDMNKIYALFILKLSEDKVITNEKYQNVKTTLENSKKLFEDSDCLNNIISIQNDDADFENINKAFNSLTSDVCYSYLTWQYIKIFGKNSKNFQDIFRIIISSFYDEKIDCNINIPSDEDFFFNISNFIENFISQKQNQLYYDELYTSNISSTQIIQHENINEDIKNLKIKDTNEIIEEENENKEEKNNNENIYFNSEKNNGRNNEKKEENINNINYDIKEIENKNGNEGLEKENNNKKENININSEEESNNEDEIEEKKIEEIENNKEDKKDKCKESINKSTAQDKNNKKKRKKRKIRNKTRYLRLIKQKKANEKKVNTSLDTKEDINKIINIEKESNEGDLIDKEEILINEEFNIDIENINKNVALESLNINDLKNDLKPKEKLKDYFQRMLKYYNIYNKKKYFYLYDLANNDYYSLENKFKFKINYDKLPFVSNMFQFLKEQLKPVKDVNNRDVYKEYQGPESFGFLIYDKYEYFYVFKNEFNRNLFNDIKNIKLYELENALVIPDSWYSNKTGIENLDEVKSHFLSSEEFENKINKYFNKLNLKELPNYFFRLIKKNQIIIPKKSDNNNNEIDMDSVDENYFSAYIEIDGAFAYFNPSKLTIINENDKLFKVSKTINVSSWGEEIEINNDDKNNFIIDQNTILLIEDKLSFPKVINDLKKEIKINKDELYTSLNFLIYKTIKKINIFNEYLISTSEGKKITYSYYLLLIYNSNPILNVENIFEKILSDLSKEKLIKYPNFYLKIIYALPCISLNDSKKVEELEAEIKIQKNNLEEMALKMKKMKLKMKEMDKKIKNMESH